MSGRRALVLAGGGVAGIAWETGVLRGLAESGADVTDADLVIGTSAGSAVGAQVTTGVTLEQMWDRQFTDGGELGAQVDLSGVMAALSAALGGDPDPVTFRARVGAQALAAPTVDETTRRAVIERRLPVETWPDRALLITAVDAHTGAFTVFDASGPATLVEAVGASCAVPGVWPPVTIQGRRYIDGGIRSGTNADLAVGCSRVVVLTPAASTAAIVRQVSGLDAEIAQLGPQTAVHVVQADADSLSAMGVNVLDPATRAPSAQAGLAQGRRLADEVRAFWHAG